MNDVLQPLRTELERLFPLADNDSLTAAVTLLGGGHAATVEQSQVSLSFGQDNTFTHATIQVGAIAGGNMTTLNVTLPPETAAALLRLRQPLVQLRAPLSDFLGREEQLQACITAFSQLRVATATIGIVSGMGGVGKTEFGVQLAHRVRAAYPDGILWISLPGREYTADEAVLDGLHQVITSIVGHDVRLPPTLSQATARYRELLTKKSMLIIVDDTPAVTSVRAFVPPVGCSLLFLSRHALSVDGVQIAVALSPFTTHDATQFLQQLAPHLHDDPYLSQLITRCGALPLALRVAGAMLRERSGLTIERYLARLNTPTQARRSLTHQDRDVYAILGLSDTMLASDDPQWADRWRMLHVCPAAFSSPTAAGIWNEPDELLVEDILTDLVRRSLLLIDPRTQLYSWHALLRDVAYERCDETLRYHAGERHATFYCKEAEIIKDMYNAGGSTVLPALARFDSVRLHIDTGWRWAREHTPASDGLLVAYHFAVNSYRRLRYQDTPADLLQEYEAARRIENWYAASITSSMIGDFARYAHDIEYALAWYTQSIALAQQTNYRLGEAINVGKLGLLYRTIGDQIQALHYLNERVRLLRGLATDARGKRTLVAALIDIGGVSHEADEMASAFAAYEEAHAVAKSIGHLVGQCKAALGLTRVLMAGGAFHEASQRATEAVRLADDLNEQDDYAEAQELLREIQAVLNRTV